MGLDAAAGVAIRDRTISLEEAKVIWEDYTSVCFTPPATAFDWRPTIWASSLQLEKSVFQTNAQKYPGGVNPNPGGVPVISTPAPDVDEYGAYKLLYNPYRAYLAEQNAAGTGSSSGSGATNKPRPAQVEAYEEQNLITHSISGKKFLGE